MDVLQFKGERCEKRGYCQMNEGLELKGEFSQTAHQPNRLTTNAPSKSDGWRTRVQAGAVMLKMLLKIG